MNSQIVQTVLESTSGTAIGTAITIQSLWSGYGSIIRVPILGGTVPSVIIKMVQFPESADQNDRGHQRKVRSFEVESSWYRSWSSRCDQFCRSALCYGSTCENGEVTMILEDLDASGFPRRSRRITETELDAVLSWLAHFHVKFLNVKPESLWEIGTYWHLATRPEELHVLKDQSLREAAATIDSLLNSCRFQTIVHGDAKIDNFCFTPDGSSCAAVDFQYTGGGIGMKDLDYFLGSILPEWECERREQELLDRYFGFVRIASERYNSPIDPDELEQVWRPLFRVARADFHRFAEGWSPGYWASNGYSVTVTRSVVESLTD